MWARFGAFVCVHCRERSSRCARPHTSPPSRRPAPHLPPSTHRHRGQRHMTGPAPSAGAPARGGGAARLGTLGTDAGLAPGRLGA